MSGIFISYRRADKAATAPLKDALAMQFGEDLVWWDADDIPAGSDWLAEIRKAILSADAMLVVIGGKWLQGTRLHEPRSVLRKEIETALGSPAAVIPVLVGGARLPKREQLPESIRDLRSRQTVVLGSDEVAARESLKRLLYDLSEILGPRRAESRIPLPTLHRQMYQMQSLFFEIRKSDPEAALELAVTGLRILDQQAPLHPDDTLLKLFRGYWLKNRAIVHLQAGRNDEAGRDLAQAQHFFGVLVRDNELTTASAYNGIGSVEAMRGRYPESLQWIDRALALVPSYAAAQDDRKDVVEALEKQAARRRSEPAD